MMKRSHKIVFAIGAVLVLVAGGLALMNLTGPPGPHFVCHRLLEGAIEQWTLETTNEMQFPNVDGSSRRSLALLLPYLSNDTNALRDYMYVPGLRPDDPESLILFYLRRPSRRTWHGDTHWFGGPRRWVVLSPRMRAPDGDSARVGGELCEAISPAEFEGRLRATLEYLRRNDRPGWRAAEEEHGQFPASIEE